MNVFVVDDSVVVRDRLVVLLSEVAGVDVVGTAADGLEAIEGVRRLKPDVVMLDIRMLSSGALRVRGVGARRGGAGLPRYILGGRQPHGARQEGRRSRCPDAGNV